MAPPDESGPPGVGAGDALLEAIEAIATHTALEAVATEALRRVLALTAADVAVLQLPDGPDGELRRYSVSALAKDHLLPLSGAPKERAGSEEARAKSPAPRAGSTLAIPLSAHGRSVGALEALRWVDRPPFSEAELSLLLQLAPHLALALHQAVTTSELKSARRELVLANAELERRVQERTEQIVRAKREWESTFDAIAEPIAIVADFRVRRANLAYAAQAGLPVQQVVGRRCHDVLAARSTPCPNCPLQGRAKGHAEVAMPEGRTFEVRPFTTALGEERAHVVQYQDRTLERRLQERLRASERMATLGQFASGAAHELNNPLSYLMSNLQGLSSLLDRLKALPELAAHASSVDEGLEMTAESLDGARRAHELIETLQNLARLESLPDEPVDVNEVVRRAAFEQLGPPSARVELSLSAKQQALVPPLQLAHAVRQLLAAASRALPPSAVLLVETADLGPDVVVRVGPKEEGAAERSEPTLLSTNELGLAAAVAIVRRAGGRIDVEAGPGRTSAFTLRLPRCSAARG